MSGTFEPLWKKNDPDTIQAAKARPSAGATFRIPEGIKEIIEKVKTTYNFENQGEALAYIVLSSQKAQVQTEAQAAEITAPLTNEIAELKAEIEKLTDTNLSLESLLKAAGEKDTAQTIEIESLQAAKNTLADIHKRLGDGIEAKIGEVAEEVQRRFEALQDLFEGDRYNKLKADTENALPQLFSIDVPTIPITDDEFLMLCLEYAERDPSNDFPFEPAARAIIERYKAQPSEQEKAQ